MALRAPERLVLADAEAAARAAADRIESLTRAAIEARGAARVALSGGSTPKRLYQLLAERPLDWTRWQVFFGDERAVPPEHPASNFRMADESLLSRVPIPGHNVHRMQGELRPERAAELYEAELGAAPLDVVLLGMGDDGHTASLFPGRPELDRRDRRVLAARAPVPPEERVTLSLSALAEARTVMFLVTGAGKARRIAEVLAQIAAGEPRLPAALVTPSEHLVFVLDEAAAGGSA